MAGTRRSGIHLSVPTALLIGGAAGAGYFADPTSIAVPAMINSSCAIKGNISLSGERIYHMPGDKYYQVTVVATNKGNRWFCSEADARRSGWRRSKV